MKKINNIRIWQDMIDWRRKKIEDLLLEIEEIKEKLDKLMPTCQEKEVKELKKRTKNKDFYLTIYQKIKEGKNPSTISKELDLPIQNIQFYIDKLKSKGIIRKKGYGVWEVKKELKVFSLGTRTNLHALQINIPIIAGEIKGSDWQIGEKLRNWLPKYKKLSILGGLTLKNNNNKSITIFAHSRDIKNLSEIDNLAFKIRAYAYEFFKNKHEVILDVMNAEVKNLNIATEDKNSEQMIKKGERFELNLNKKAEKIFRPDKINAKSWIDGSPFKFSAETNDKEWKRAYLSMPFMMRDMVQATHYIAQNYASHVKLVEKASKVMEKLNKRLSQTKLTEFI